MDTNTLSPPTQRARVLSLPSSKNPLPSPKIPSKSSLRKSLNSYHSSPSPVTPPSQELNLSCRGISSLLVSEDFNSTKAFTSPTETNHLSLLKGDLLSPIDDETSDTFRSTSNSSSLDSCSSNNSLNELDLNESLTDNLSNCQVSKTKLTPTHLPVDSLPKQTEFSDSKPLNPPLEPKNFPDTKNTNPSFDNLRKKFMLIQEYQENTSPRPIVPPPRIKRTEGSNQTTSFSNFKDEIRRKATGLSKGTSLTTESKDTEAAEIPKANSINTESEGTTAAEELENTILATQREDVKETEFSSDNRNIKDPEVSKDTSSTIEVEQVEIQECHPERETLLFTAPISPAPLINETSILPPTSELVSSPLRSPNLTEEFSKTTTLPEVKDNNSHSRGSSQISLVGSFETKPVISVHHILATPNKVTSGSSLEETKSAGSSKPGTLDSSETETEIEELSDGSDFDEEVEFCTLRKTEIFSCISVGRTSNIPDSKLLQLTPQRNHTSLPAFKPTLLSKPPSNFNSEPQPTTLSVCLPKTSHQLNLTTGNSIPKIYINPHSNQVNLDSITQPSNLTPSSNLESTGTRPLSPNPNEFHSELGLKQTSFQISTVENLLVQTETSQRPSNLTPSVIHHSHPSVNSQSSGVSRRSDGSLVTKVKGLYDSFRTKHEEPAPLVKLDPKPPLFKKPKASVHLPHPSESRRSFLPFNFTDKRANKSVELQTIPSHVRRISLLDACSLDTRPEYLCNTNLETNPENTDWEFWGQLINSFGDMKKSNHLALRRNIRQGIPVSVRGTVWELLAGIKDTELISVYSNLLNQISPNPKAIHKDMPRACPSLPFFNIREGGDQESLFNVLKCYSLYDPEVGYCPGLSFLVGPLLLNMPDEEAFCVLVKIMDTLRQYFTPDMEGLQVCTYQFERLMEETIPQVYYHLQELGIPSALYASQWFMTFFAYRSSMKLVFRVLDIMLLEGTDILIKVALALLRDNADLIISKGPDELLSYLKLEILEQYHFQTDHIIAMACDQKISERNMARWSKEYTAELAKQAEEAAYASSLQGINDQLSLTNQTLTAQIETVTLTNQDLNGHLSKLQQSHHHQIHANSELQVKLNELELLLHTERQRAEAAMQEQLDILAQKNLSLVTKNAELEDTLVQAQQTILQLQAKLSFPT